MVGEAALPAEQTFTWETLLKGFAGIGKKKARANDPPVGGPSGLEDLTSALPDCPRTRWDTEGIDLAAAQARYRAEEMPEPVLTIDAKAAIAGGNEEAWLRENREVWADWIQEPVADISIMVMGSVVGELCSGSRF